MQEGSWPRCAERNSHSGYLALSYRPFGLLVPLRFFFGGGAGLSFLCFGQWSVE